MRVCSKAGCTRPAVSTLTYDYGNQSVVLGPAASVHDPHALDLCEHHAERLTVPKGWEVIRLQSRFEPPAPSADDLSALVDIVREASASTENSHSPAQSPSAWERQETRDIDSEEDSRAPLRAGRFSVIPGEGAAPKPTSAQSRLHSQRGPLQES